MPFDGAFLALGIPFPLDVGVDPHGVAVIATRDRIDHIVNKTRSDVIVVVLRTNHLLNLVRQCLNGQLLADDHLQRVPHRIPLADIAVEMETTQPFRSNVQQCVAADDQMQQCLVEHHTVVAGLDLAEHLPLDLAEHRLKVGFLLRADTLPGHFRLIQREPEKLLRGREQPKKHSTRQVETSACPDAVPWHRESFFGVRDRL